MILSIHHADRLLRHIQAQINAREIVNGRPVAWTPTADPRELVRRGEWLFNTGSDHLSNGNVLHDALRSYLRGLAVEITMEAQP